MNKYKTIDRAEKKAHKIGFVKAGTTRGGDRYIKFQVADSKKQEDGSYTYNNFNVFTYQQELELNNGDYIEFVEMYGVENSHWEYNGKSGTTTTIFADVKKVQGPQGSGSRPVAPAQPTIIEQDPIFGDSDSDLPF